MRQGGATSQSPMPGASPSPFTSPAAIRSSSQNIGGEALRKSQMGMNPDLGSLGTFGLTETKPSTKLFSPQNRKGSQNELNTQ